MPPPRILLSAAGLFLAFAAHCAPADVLDVRSFGAKGDGVANDTAAFQSALDTCAVNGGGEVRVPSGRYLIGSVQIGSRTLLRLEAGAVIAADPNPVDYPVVDVRWEGRWQPGRRALIYASHVDHIGIVGPGRIESSFSRTNGPDGLRNPVVIEPVDCSDILWDGFTVVQGDHWATHPTYCTGLVARNITIRSRRDGIDVDSCRGVRIEHCDFDTGDDCVSLKSGRGMDGARIARPCEDVAITGCRMIDHNWACIGIGSEISGGVRGVRIDHCVMSAPRSYAIYLKSRVGRAGAYEHISAEDLEISEGSFLRINLATAGNTSTVDDPVPGSAGIPRASDLRFSRIKVDCRVLVQATEIPPEKPLRGLVLEDISGRCTTGISLAHVSGLRIGRIQVSGFQGPLVRASGVTSPGQ